MRVSKSGIIGGLIFILFGVLFAARAFGYRVDIFFNGWWTLFIIVPCIIGLFEKGNKAPYVLGIIFGCLLLLSAQGYIHWWMFRRLFVAFIFVAIGISLIFRERISARRYGDDYSRSGDDYYKDKSDWKGDTSTYTNGNTSTDYNSDGYTGSEKYSNYSEYTDENNQNWQQDSQKSHNNNGSYKSDYQGSFNHRDKSFQAFLTSRNISLRNEIFNGAYISAILGNLTLDLRDAVITNNVIIDLTTVLGGIDIYVPQGVKVIVNANPILANVENKTQNAPLGQEANTIYINGNCILGGVIIN